MQTEYEAAAAAIDVGDVESLKRLLGTHADLANARGESNTPLLIHLIDWPGHRPHADQSARALLEAGADVDVRRNSENGTALSGALCTEEIDVIEVLIEFGADIHAPCGWQPGTVLELAEKICENLVRAKNPKVVAISRLFSQAAGRPVPQRTRMGGSVPLLLVSDVNAALKYYSEILGFHTNFVFDSDCDDLYASIQRGGAEFHLTGCQCVDRRHVGNLYVRVDVDSSDDLCAEFSAVGVKIRHEPKNEPWGMREFTIEDPDGNWIVFTGPIPDTDEA